VTGEVRLSGARGGVGVDVSQGPLRHYHLEFSAPVGRTLAPGLYAGAQRYGFGPPNSPGMDIGGDGRGCNKLSGAFFVQDIAFDAEGKVTRAWLVYEQHCEGMWPALFGEVRVGEPSLAPAVLAPQAITWPAGDVSRPSTTVPVSLFAVDARLTVKRVSVIGRNASDFVVRKNGCTGDLAAGSSCTVQVRAVPRAPGSRVATLRFLDSDGAPRDVALGIFAFGGLTRVVLTSDLGDSVGQSQNRSFPVARNVIYAVGSRQGIEFRLAAGKGWVADFLPPRGRTLTRRTYTGVARYPFNGGRSGINVSRTDRVCDRYTGQFTVNSVAWWPGGGLRAASVSFEQHCDGAAPALRGTFEFRAPKRLLPCVVPRLLGRRLQAARRALVLSSCRLGKVTGRGRVASQSPSPGRRLKNGARVDVELSRGKL
jgi:hypothetical protein